MEGKYQETSSQLSIWLCQQWGLRDGFVGPSTTGAQSLLCRQLLDGEARWLTVSRFSLWKSFLLSTYGFSSNTPSKNAILLLLFITVFSEPNVLLFDIYLLWMRVDSLPTIYQMRVKTSEDSVAKIMGVMKHVNLDYPSEWMSSFL